MNSITKFTGQRPAASGPTEPILAFACDEDTLDTISRVVPGGRRGVEVREGGIGAAIAAQGQGSRAELLIVDLSDSGNPVADIATLAGTCGPDTTIIALGLENDVSLYRALLGCGVTDYLVKPITPQELRRTLLTAGRSEEQAQASSNGRVGTIIGARGGTGASSLAIGVAWLLAHQHRKQVALVDLDLHFGTSALSLDLEPSNGLRSALENADRIDSLFVASALTNISDTMFVLGSEEALDQTFDVQPEALELLIAELRRIFDMVVIDLPRHLVPAASLTLAAMDAITVVTDLSLAGLRDSVRLRTGLSRLAPDAQISVVANRVGMEKNGELSPAEFERGLGGKVDFLLPEDPKAAKAALDGKPLATVLAAGKAAPQFAGLIQRMGGIDTGSGKQKRLFGLLG
jgi:pilus assembly protein CpaE